MPQAHYFLLLAALLPECCLDALDKDDPTLGLGHLYVRFLCAGLLLPVKKKEEGYPR